MDCKIVERWDEYLSFFPADKRDIYYSEKYVGLYENKDNRALCIVCSDNNSVMLMPYLRGTINGYYDFETAYGYGGPIANTDDIEWCHKAYLAMYDHFKSSNYVCGFIRCHPLLVNERFIINYECSAVDTRYIELIYDRQTISIDTSERVEDIWKNQISSKNRNMIRKAEKNDLVYRSEYDFASYDEFIHLYESTMKRLSADSFYFFDNSYFDSLKSRLKGNAFLGTVRKNDELICAAIFFYSDVYGHYHLEGSNRNYATFGANNYLLWKVACEMHELGLKEFHLGGGTTSKQDDSLFKFKKAFSDNEKRFYICKNVFNKDVYDAICADWQNKNNDKIELYGRRLLKYRY